MRFEVKEFKGMRPSRSADLLDNGEAQVATNSKLTGGGLLAYNAPGPTPGGVVTVASGTKAIYRFGQSSTSEVLYWFQSLLDCDFVKGPVVNDTEERTYWTDGAYPKKTNFALATGSAPYPSNSYRMGVPAPATISAPAVTGTPTNASDPAETVIYCMTYVTAWGEEGPPCIVTASRDIKPGMAAGFTGLPGVPAGVSPAFNSSNSAITGKRIYRSATGSSSTKFQLVNTEGDIAVAATTYSDTKLTRDLGDTLVTTGWVEPPDTLTGLCEMANGIMAGFTGTTLCFSEPFAPYAWPLRYRQSVDAPIVGIMGFDQSLFVGTTSSVYLFTGTDPAQMSSEKLPYALSLSSKRSMVRMLGGVVFAAPTGLYLVNASGVKPLTAGIVTSLEWGVYNPPSFQSFEYEGRYIAFGSASTVVMNFGDSPSFATSSVVATVGYRSVRTAALYIVQQGSTTIEKWDSSSAALSQVWQSGVFNAPYPISMSAARVLADAYPVFFTPYADVAAGPTITVASNLPFRLPVVPNNRRHSFAVTAPAVIREVVVATSMRDLGAGSRDG